jgi:hypothetical protein
VWGSLLLLAHFETSKMVPLGLLRVYIGLILIVIEDFYWEEFTCLLSWWNLLWCIRGDFNVTRFPSERLGEIFLCLAMVEFSDIIFDQGLMAILLVEGYFTWSNKQDPPSWLRIDRFLVSPEWETQFPDLSKKKKVT